MQNVFLVRKDSGMVLPYTGSIVLYLSGVSSAEFVVVATTDQKKTPRAKVRHTDDYEVKVNMRCARRSRFGKGRNLIYARVGWMG